MSPKTPKSVRRSAPKVGKVLSLPEAKSLLALENQISTHVKNLNTALGTLKKVGKKVGALRRRHYGPGCGV